MRTKSTSGPFNGNPIGRNPHVPNVARSRSRIVAPAVETANRRAIGATHGATTRGGELCQYERTWNRR